MEAHWRTSEAVSTLGELPFSQVGQAGGVLFSLRNLNVWSIWALSRVKLDSCSFYCVSLLPRSDSYDVFSSMVSRSPSLPSTRQSGSESQMIHFKPRGVAFGC